jgi:hypothetical protein
MIIKGNNGKASARKRQPKSAPSSSKSKRSMAVPKNPVSGDNIKAADELEGNLVCDESRALQSEASAVVLEETGIIEATGGTDLPDNPTELTAITLHQPWASLIAAGKKHYETRNWATNYRGSIAIHAAKKLHEDESLISLLEIPASEIPLGAVVAIAELTDCILIDEEFILKQSSFEQYLGLWEVGRYAWKLENVRAIEPIAATGKQGLWKWEHKQESKEYAFGFEVGDRVHTQYGPGFIDKILPDRKEVYVRRDSGGFTCYKFDEAAGEISRLPCDAFGNIKGNPLQEDCGEVQHLAEDNGQLKLLEFDSNEPPDPDDFPGDLEAFKAAYSAWESNLTDTAEEE